MNTSNATQQKTGDKPDFYSFRGISMYAKVFEPSAYNEEYDIPAAWSIDVLLDKEAVAKAKADGFAIKPATDKHRAFCEGRELTAKGYSGEYISIKKRTTRQKWDRELNQAVKDSEGVTILEPATRPRVVDGRGNEIPEEAGLLIGNGSEVEVTCIVTKPQVNGREQFGRFGGRLIETKILELVPVKKQTGSFVFEEYSNEAESESRKPQPVQSENELLDDELPFIPDEG